MKAALLGLALVLVLGVLVALLRPAPRSGFEPFRYGRDACARCRMLLAEPGFAGEMRDARGQLTRYDDLGCLLGALREAHAETPQVWVEDHTTHALVPLLRAALVQGERIRTPMGHGIVAFADGQAARAFAEQHGARLVPLEDLLHHRLEGSASR